MQVGTYRFGNCLLHLRSKGPGKGSALLTEPMNAFYNDLPVAVVYQCGLTIPK